MAFNCHSCHMAFNCNNHVGYFRSKEGLLKLKIMNDSNHVQNPSVPLWKDLDLGSHCILDVKKKTELPSPSTLKISFLKWETLPSRIAKLWGVVYSYSTETLLMLPPQNKHNNVAVFFLNSMLWLMLALTKKHLMKWGNAEQQNMKQANKHRTRMWT